MFSCFLVCQDEANQEQADKQSVYLSSFAKILMVRLASNARAIDMLRVENGMVLIIVGLELLT